MPTSARTRSKSTSIACGAALKAPVPPSRQCAVSATCWKRMKSPPKPSRLQRLVPPGSLARHLVIRLMPAVLVLILMDVVVTWYFTGTISLEEWLERDLFWAMLLSQLALLLIFV